jgi:hypothetical protein
MNLPVKTFSCFFVPLDAGEWPLPKSKKKIMDKQ